MRWRRRWRRDSLHNSAGAAWPDREDGGGNAPQPSCGGGGRARRVPRASTSFFDCLCACFFFSRRRGAITKALRGITSRYKAVTSRYGAVTSRYTVVTEPLPILRAVTELGGSQEPVPYNGIRSGPSLPRRVLPLGLFPQRPCHRGILYGEPPVPTLCGRLREREAGWWPTSLGAL